MEEQLMLIDTDDTTVGTCGKMQAHREGWLHRAFSIFVFDSSRRLLLQQRAFDKYHSGGLWSNTCCGHPRPGETLDQATHRRLNEEMGFSCNLRKVVLENCSHSTDGVRNSFFARLNCTNRRGIDHHARGVDLVCLP